MFARNRLLLLVLAAAFTSEARSSDPTPVEGDRLAATDAMVREFFDRGSFPSLSVGLVLGDETVYARSLGVADRASGRPASPRTLYELGSVGKVFTSTVLAILHRQGAVRIDDPAARWVPSISRVKGRRNGAPEITLGHLATHSSGLPGLPSNVDHLPPFQWKGYSPRQLDEGLESTELLHPVGRGFKYSSLGMGLLGHALSVAGETTYEALVDKTLLSPLGMRDTVITLRPGQAERYSVGYDAEDLPGEVPYFEYGILAGCGAHRSTVADMTRFLMAQWGAAGDASPLDEGVRSEIQRIRWRSPDGEIVMALGWFAAPIEGVGTLLIHRGRTPGHGAVVAFIPEQRAGVVLLANRGGRGANVAMADFAESLLTGFVSAGDGRRPAGG